MYVWKITLTAKDFYGSSHTYIYLGVASKAKVAINKTLTLAKKEPWTNRRQQRIVKSLNLLQESQQERRNNYGLRIYLYGLFGAIQH